MATVDYEELGWNANCRCVWMDINKKQVALLVHQSPVVPYFVNINQKKHNVDRDKA
jgi:hypothetical protein